MLSKKKKIGIGVVVGLGIIGALSGGGEEVPVPDTTIASTQVAQTVAAATKAPVTKPPATKAPVTKTPANERAETEAARIAATMKILEESFATSGTIRLDKEMKLFLLTPYDTKITESAMVVRDSGLLRADWENMKASYAGLSQSIHSLLPGYGFGVVNTANTDNLLLVLMNGITVYDVTEE